MADVRTRPAAPTARILLVDDEPHVLEAATRLLRTRYDVTQAIGGTAGIAALEAGPPYDVLVTDMRMPEVDGVAVLQAARRIAPDTTRILLTGHADLTAAIAAVNDGAVFRFLTKPCSPDVMQRALAEGVRQHQLLIVEHDLMERTLKGVLQMCMELIALVHPHTLSRATRVRRMVAQLAAHTNVQERWTVEVAALIAHLGGITLPVAILEKLHAGHTLTPPEVAIAQRVPIIGAQLVGAIPRLEPVRDVLLFQRTHYDGTNSPEPGVAGEALPIGARLLKLADDHDILASRGMAPAARLQVLESRVGRYDPKLLAILHRLLTNEQRPVVVAMEPTRRSAPPPDGTQEVRLGDVEVGMVFAQDVRNEQGLLLIARGQLVTHLLIDRILSLWPHLRHERVRVEVPAGR
jgi:response regulator RpfG family c-di-GMP phosphodiesterase